jgi:diketogulonate reductase-like aldo/keto reductase
MKGRCKIIELETHDVLVQRLVNESDGEHIKITVWFPLGQMIQTGSFGDEDESAKEADEVYEAYGKEQAQAFLDAILGQLEGVVDEKTDDKKED